VAGTTWMRLHMHHPPMCRLARSVLERAEDDGLIAGAPCIVHDEKVLVDEVVRVGAAQGHTDEALEVLPLAP
jgi:hypothetical protein